MEEVVVDGLNCNPMDVDTLSMARDVRIHEYDASTAVKILGRLGPNKLVRLYIRNVNLHKKVGKLARLMRPESKLRVLALDRCELTEADFADILEAAKTSALAELRLEGNKIRLARCAKLAERLKEAGTLEHLFLYGHSMTREDSDALMQAVARAPQLSVVQADGLDKANAEAISSMVEQRRVLLSPRAASSQPEPKKEEPPAPSHPTKSSKVDSIKLDSSVGSGLSGPAELAEMLHFSDPKVPSNEVLPMEFLTLAPHRARPIVAGGSNDSFLHVDSTASSVAEFDSRGSLAPMESRGLLLTSPYPKPHPDGDYVMDVDLLSPPTLGNEHSKEEDDPEKEDSTADVVDAVQLPSYWTAGNVESNAFQAEQRVSDYVSDGAFLQASSADELPPEEAFARPLPPTADGMARLSEAQSSVLLALSRGAAGDDLEHVQRIRDGVRQEFLRKLERWTAENPLTPLDDGLYADVLQGGTQWYRQSLRAHELLSQLRNVESRKEDLQGLAQAVAELEALKTAFREAVSSARSVGIFDSHSTDREAAALRRLSDAGDAFYVRSRHLPLLASELGYPEVVLALHDASSTVHSLLTRPLFRASYLLEQFDAIKPLAQAISLLPAGKRSALPCRFSVVDRRTDRAAVLLRYDLSTADGRALFEREEAWLGRLQGQTGLPVAHASFEHSGGRLFGYLVLGPHEAGGLALLPRGQGKKTELRRVAWQLVRGLATFHGAMGVHGALEPAAVLVDAEGNAMLGHLGVSTVLSEPIESYAAPELLGGVEQPPSPLSDVYSLGLLLLELCFPDYSRPNPHDLLRDEVRLFWPRGQWLEMDRLLVAMLAKDPADRKDSHSLLQMPIFQSLHSAEPPESSASTSNRDPAQRKNDRKFPNHWKSGLEELKRAPAVVVKLSAGEYLCTEVEAWMNRGRMDLAGLVKSSSRRAISRFEVVQIKRIENLTNWEIYQTKRAQVQRRPGGIPLLRTRNASRSLDSLLGMHDSINERLLFHGTARSVAEKILYSQLDSRVSYPGKFGSGIYFAEDAVLSDSYSPDDESPDSIRCMFLCRVLLGTPLVTPSPLPYLRRPPCIQGCQNAACPGHKGLESRRALCDRGSPCYLHNCATHPLYDSVVGDLPLREFVVYDDKQVLLEALVYYRAVPVAEFGRVMPIQRPLVVSEYTIGNQFEPVVYNTLGAPLVKPSQVAVSEYSIIAEGTELSLHEQRVNRLHELCPFIKSSSMHQLSDEVRSSWLLKFLGVGEPEHDAYRKHYVELLELLWPDPIFWAFKTANDASEILWTLDDGALLVRLSGTMPGNIAISARIRNQVSHTRLQITPAGLSSSSVVYPSLDSFIELYERNSFS